MIGMDDRHGTHSGLLKRPARGFFLPVAKDYAPSAPENQAGVRYGRVRNDHSPNSGVFVSAPDTTVTDSSPVAATGGRLSVGALPPVLSQFIHTFLGERAVMRETVKKAAPAFRRYDGSF
jgi:hypothetical protein